ncbi:MAG: putative ABC transport system permease protein [Gammaproteobacteria bacterium]|jgi:putative ABC transport system permease protein
MPGKSETSGNGLGSMMGNTTRDLTLADAESLRRHPSILRVAPLNIGAAEISWKSRKREIMVMGSSSELLQIRHWSLASGQFLAESDWQRAAPVCVIGSKVRDELFGAQAALGQWVRLGQNRYRVIGILASEGRSIGIDVQDTVVIPVASAQSLFNTSSLYRIFIESKNQDSIPSIIQFVTRQIKQRHFGEEDVTVITLDSVLETFDSILRALTMGMSMGVFGSEKPLTIQDVEALKRQSYTKSVVGLIQGEGNAEVEGNQRLHRTTIYGTSTNFPQTFKMPVELGRFLPDDDPIG